MPTETQLMAQLKRLCTALSKQQTRLDKLDGYYEGDHPVPAQVRENRATKAYTTLMGLAQTDWPKLIVDSVEERLEIQGFNFADQAAADQVWADWQRNQLDADSGLVHQGALTGGKAYVIVWADGDGNPTVTPEHGGNVIVEYAPGSRVVRIGALRRWFDMNADRWFATLYRSDGIYKYQAKITGNNTPNGDDGWEMREVPDEPWPLDNPLGVVPVIELGVNRTLKFNPFGDGRGEFESALAHIDRINYTTFSLLAAMTWSGFPFRALIGDPIVRDEDDKPMEPFDVAQDRIAQIENPQGKMVQLPEASLTNYGSTLEMYVKHLAAVTKTPAHYLLGEMVNLSADAIRAGEAGLISKVRRHHRALGEGWEEVARLMLLVRDDASAADTGAQLVWSDPESRSMAERADAAVKLANILPWQAIARKVLGLSPQEIQQLETMRGSEALGALIAPQQPAAANGTPS